MPCLFMICRSRAAILVMLLVISTRIVLATSGGGGWEETRSSVGITRDEGSKKLG
jgi:hypothetical protein